MDFAALYKSKLTTPEEAVKVVKSGDWVDYGWCTGTPNALDKALAARMDELENVNFRGGVLMRRPAIFDVPDVADKLTWNSWHMSGIERKACTEGFGFYSALRYSELPRWYRENVGRINVTMIQVAPMDAQGWFSFGPQASHLKAVCEASDVVIVEVNKYMPRCLGLYEEAIHVSEVDMIVENDEPMPQMGGGAAPTAVDEAVAKLIVEEIPNGACLQLGIGGMPNTVGAMIAESDLKDLGVHTEMYVDAFVDIAKAGKINGSKKAIDTGKQVFAFGAGTQKLYDYVNNNPECMSAPVSYTNDARTIAQIDNFISINNIVDVDLFGQMNAESARIKKISGAGGQLDFVLGAYLSRGGKSFICCSSTFKKKDGTLESRIRPTLETGSVVTDARPCAHWFVTEYGKEPQGSDCMAACGSADFGCAPGFPRAADQGRREDASVETLQQAIISERYAKSANVVSALFLSLYPYIMYGSERKISSSSFLPLSVRNRRSRAEAMLSRGRLSSSALTRKSASSRMRKSVSSPA